MSALLKNRWLWVAVVWAGALFLSFLNHQTIDSILAIQAQNQTLRRELMFQQQNARRLDRILEEHAKLFLPAESVQLGMLAAKGMLTEMASKLELNLSQITLSPPPKDAETVLMSLSFSGPVERIIRFLSLLNAHRYLHQKQVGIKLDSKNGDGSCELNLALRCRTQQPALNESMPNEAPARSAL